MPEAAAQIEQPQGTNSPFHQPLAPPGPGSARPADKESLELAHMTAGERVAHERSQLSFDDRSDPSRFIHTRNPDGSTSIKDRTDGTAQPTDRATAAATDGSQPVVEGDKLVLGELTLTHEEARELMVAKAAADLRKASLPPTPADYEAKLPENLELPAGVKFEIDQSDPLLHDARAWAHSRGFSQEDFSSLVALYASAKGREQALFNTAAAAEVAKLGVNGAQRVTAVEQFLRGMVGNDLGSAMRGMLVTQKIVAGFERLMGKFQSQGAATFSQAHREPGNSGGRVSDEQYATMTPAQRLDYARSFDQRQFSAGGR
ncbi:hypothetical protein JQ621_03130 [Bradyrhizobium manausense]|uniref:capsid assembly protein n=1 Tax=Bradyrhizobium manausense TaxID=989370 RepID=UPI001BA7168E|nr:hypothetical protein [Bradyrhizobium manausense]MBR1086461.1 hypothetical protein [Bradyrhizobium manausense]